LSGEWKLEEEKTPGKYAVTHIRADEKSRQSLLND
jgi:hypothetical protein